MSRGLGRLQQAILNRVKASGLTTVESARWDVRKEGGEDDLTVATLNAVKRAVESLVARKLIICTERPLQSVAECIAHYPGKTTRVAIRKLRVELLPALLQPDSGQPIYQRYSRDDNEKFQYERLSDADKKLLRRNWLSVERELAALLGSTDDAQHRSRLARLYAKGESIFDSGRLMVSQAFSEHLARCRLILSADLLGRLEHFCTSLLDVEMAGNLKVRSFVHTFANVSSRGTCSLKDDTIEHLNKVRRDYLESLPDYKSSSVSGNFFMRDNSRQDPILHRLFDHTVFQSFHFLELVG